MSRSSKESSSFGQEEGRFLWGEGVFLIFSDTGVFLGGDFEEILSSGTFLKRAILPSFLSLGGPPC